MNQEDFIAGLKIVVEEGSIKDVIQGLEKPAGRSLNPDTVELSEWYLSQSVEDKKNVESIIVESVRTTLFGVLCAVDGVRKISDHSGWLELNYLSDEDGQVSKIKNGMFGGLHDIYRATF